MVSSIREGETSWHRNSSRSNGIQLMTKLIEGLTPAGADKAALSLSQYILYVHFSVFTCVWPGCISLAKERMVPR